MSMVLYNALFWDFHILITESISFCNERYCTMDVHVFKAEVCDNLYHSVMSVILQNGVHIFNTEICDNLYRSVFLSACTRVVTSDLIVPKLR